MRYSAITTLSGTHFAVGEDGITQIEQDTAQGALTGTVLVYRKSKYVAPPTTTPAPGNPPVTPPGKPKPPVPVSRPAQDPDVELHARVLLHNVEVFYHT